MKAIVLALAALAALTLGCPDNAAADKAADKAKTEAKAAGDEAKKAGADAVKAGADAVKGVEAQVPKPIEPRQDDGENAPSGPAPVKHGW